MNVLENESLYARSSDSKEVCQLSDTMLKLQIDDVPIEKSEKQGISRGSWIIVIAAFLSFSLNAGLLYTFSIYYVQFLMTFHESRARTAWIGSLFNCLFQLIGPFAGCMTKTFGCRITIMAGGIGSAVGYITSSYATSINYLLFSLGVLTAIFLSFVYTGFTIALALYCQKFHCIAAGISFSGIGFGIFIFSPLLEYTVEYYGWRGSMFIQAGMALNFCVCGALVSSHHLPKSQKSIDVQEVETQTLPADNHLRHQQHFPSSSLCYYCKYSSVLTNYTFICFTLSYSIWVMGTSTMFVTYKDLAILYGYGDRFSVVISSMGIADIIGRLLVGIILSKCRNQIIIYSTICLFFSAVTLCLHVTVISFEMFLALAVMFSFFYAKQCVIIAVAPAAMYGADNLALTLGVLFFFGGCTTLFGAPIGGWLIDATKTRSAVLWFTSITNFAAAILMGVVTRMEKRDKLLFLNHRTAQIEQSS